LRRSASTARTALGSRVRQCSERRAGAAGVGAGAGRPLGKQRLARRWGAAREAAGQAHGELRGAAGSEGMATKHVGGGGGVGGAAEQPSAVQRTRSERPGARSMGGG